MSALMPLPFEKPIVDLERQLVELENQPNPSANVLEVIRNMRTELTKLRREIYDQLSPWDIVRVARHESRPQSLDYIELVFDEFVELHGDKAYGDDRAILTGLATIDDRKVMLIAQQKGRNLEERIEHNFGMAHPEGYRKALMKMEMAAKYKLPIVCLIDTAGAYPGIEAEERGQAYQIAYNLREMSRIDTPIVCVVIGEGGSGGALGIGIGDHVAMLRFAYYSVISPEGCAGILWKHARHADKAANALRFTSKDLLEFGIVDEVIDEPLGGAHRDHRRMAMLMKASLNEALKKLGEIPKDQLLDRRYEKFRKIGHFEEQVIADVTEAT
ncbi:acetyl-CoA carboxylase carboxyltransferase subunit alpha [Planctomicrobium sp. SH668]|uniref:acetyl-CoA carboxylase carboxyltransferase subunit alpha n=1 Tax=Planctomicrobium sp. SH668 TaxID=3448126 RepID=UPI003F5C2698